MDPVIGPTGLSAVPIIVLALLVLIIVVQALIIWSIKRHRDPDLHIECDSPFHELTPSMAGLSLGSAVSGNTVEVCRTELFDVSDAIASAAADSAFETFL